MSQRCGAPDAGTSARRLGHHRVYIYDWRRIEGRSAFSGSRRPAPQQNTTLGKSRAERPLTPSNPPVDVRVPVTREDHVHFGDLRRSREFATEDGFVFQYAPRFFGRLDLAGAMPERLEGIRPSRSTGRTPSPCRPDPPGRRSASLMWRGVKYSPRSFPTVTECLRKYSNASPFTSDSASSRDSFDSIPTTALSVSGLAMARRLWNTSPLRL